MATAGECGAGFNGTWFVLRWCAFDVDGVDVFVVMDHGIDELTDLTIEGVPCVENLRAEDCVGRRVAGHARAVVVLVVNRRSLGESVCNVELVHVDCSRTGRVCLAIGICAIQLAVTVWMPGAASSIST